ncbi:MAG: haloacid dehalogenase [Propionibacteriales bacterium]|nr:haloacid dehalogenase [Propionibacteriales bacterium]
MVTFDLFSALVDSRTGASVVLGRLGATRQWHPTGTEVYDDWDTRNKEAQRACEAWVPYEVLARDALAETYAALDLDGDAADDLTEVLRALPDWPLWPDVEDTLPMLACRYRVGLLSNVDDALFLRTRAATYVDPDLAMTSERLGVYKPDPRIYHRAQETLGPMVHIATSARDVRGSLEAGIPVVRLRRPGHHLDPDGPRPTVEVDAMALLEELIPVAWSRAGRTGRTAGDD